MNRVTLVGLDFGTTTSSAVVADASLLRNAVTGRTELTQVQERFRSEMVFTPIEEDHLDLAAVESHLEAWLAAGGVQTDLLFGGGALLTGLTAQRQNATRLVELIHRRLGDALVATADDPTLESWLAFLGNCTALSQVYPDRPVLNLDIGGGTTSLALGQAGQVRRTGCIFVGARHVQVVPGTYQVVRLSRHAKALFDHLGIGKGVGDELTSIDVERIGDFYVVLLEAAARGQAGSGAIERLHVQVPFQLPPVTVDPIMTFSGGVGEMIYDHVHGQPWPTTTRFGDLGIELAQRLVQSARLSRDLHTYVPAGGGRATVLGLLRHSTEISGSTLFLPRPDVLPLAEVPVLGEISPATGDADLNDLLGRVMRSPRGGCLVVSLVTADGAAVRVFGGRLATALGRASFPRDHPLVLLVRENVGKVLGHYVTRWGQVPLNLVILDEVALRDARYVQIGRLRQQVVPVSFYGLCEPGTLSCAF